MLLVQLHTVLRDQGVLLVNCEVGVWVKILVDLLQLAPNLVLELVAGLHQIRVGLAAVALLEKPSERRENLLVISARLKSLLECLGLHLPKSERVVYVKRWVSIERKERKKRNFEILKIFAKF